MLYLSQTPNSKIVFFKPCTIFSDLNPFISNFIFLDFFVSILILTCIQTKVTDDQLLKIDVQAVAFPKF